MEKKYGFASFAAALLCAFAWCGAEDLQDKKFGDSENAQVVSPACYAGRDDLERTLPLEARGNAKNDNFDHQVGIFYFLWHGEHGLQGPFDNNKIIAKYPDAAHNASRWGGYGVYHWWGEPLFGYYTNRDRWVIRKHVELLTDAGIDFLVLDTTNAVTYAESAKILLDQLLEYQKQGFNVPKVAFYTNTASGHTIQLLYHDLYKAHPEYASLWYEMDGKPMIVGRTDDRKLTEECKKYFRIKESQWPNVHFPDGRFLYYPDGFPWISFETEPHLFDQVKPSVMNVSVAQHCGTVAFSSSALYGDKTNHTRSWHDGANDTRKNAWLYGFNLAEQFKFAFRKNPDILFITGWNEWIAGNWSNDPKSVAFIDCCDTNNSRDIEPMKGGYFDNYYMQMIGNIRRFKGSPAIPVDRIARPDPQVPMLYRDYAGDNAGRNARGYGELYYKTPTGANDIVKAGVCRDGDKLLFCVETKDELTRPEAGENWMRLLIKTKSKGTNFAGYQFVVNRNVPQDSRALLERYTENGSWHPAAEIAITVDGDRLSCSVPLRALGLDQAGIHQIEFKWSDSQELFGKTNPVESFYTEGDCAPGGRLNYVYRFEVQSL